MQLVEWIITLDYDIKDNFPGAKSKFCVTWFIRLSTGYWYLVPPVPKGICRQCNPTSSCVQASLDIPVSSTSLTLPAYENKSSTSFADLHTFSCNLHSHSLGYYFSHSMCCHQSTVSIFKMLTSSRYSRKLDALKEWENLLWGSNASSAAMG